MLTAVVVTWVTASLCWPSRLLVPILLLPVSSFGMVIVTPDTPLLLFGSLYLLWLIRVHERLADERVRWWLWVLGGLLLGGGLLVSTNVLLAVAGGISFLRRALAAVGRRVRALRGGGCGRGGIPDSHPQRASGFCAAIPMDARDGRLGRVA